MDFEPKVKSLYKALMLLECLSGDEYELGITELAQKSGLLKSSVHNIMSTFMQAGFVEQNSSNNKYHLGKKLLTLSNSYTAHNTLQDRIQLILRHLADKTGETVYYGIPYGKDVLYISCAYTKNSFRIAPVTGVIAPMYCTGIGKALLSFSDQTTIDAVCNGELKAYTARTLTDTKQLRAEVELTRQRGYSIDNCEHEDGIKCVGMPIVRNGELLGALSISGYEPHFSEDRIGFFVECLKEAVSLICF